MSYPRKYKITDDDINFGPSIARAESLPDLALTCATVLNDQGWRRTSNAYCHVAKIDREDWLDFLATQMNCCVADFYNKDGSGVSDHWRDHYIRVYSKAGRTVAPAVFRLVKGY